MAGEAEVRGRNGISDVIRKEAERQISDAEFEREASRAPVQLRTKEDLFCFRLFAEHLEVPDEVVREIVGTTAVY